MAPVITLKGIDEAISNLGYQNQKGTKSRLVQAIRAQYERDDSILSVMSIDSDSLIRMLWVNALDPITVRNRKRNLSSIKSSVNADFRKLYREGKNPEGITISSLYTFIMSEEAKDSALEALRGVAEMTGTGGLGRLTGALNTLREALSSTENVGKLSKDQEPGALRELRDLIKGVSDKIGVAGMGPVEAGKDESGSRGAVGSAGGERPGSAVEEGAGLESGEAGAVAFAFDLEEMEETTDIDPEEVETIETVEEVEEEAAVEISPNDLLEDIEGAEEGGAAESDMESADEILEAIDEEEDAINEEEIEDVDEEGKFGEAVPEEEVEALEEAEPHGDPEELEDVDLVEEVEAFDADALYDQPIEDIGAICSMEDQEAEQGLGSLDAEDGGFKGGIEDKGNVGGNVNSLVLTDDFEEEGLLAEAEGSGRLLVDFGEENLNGEPGSNQNTELPRMLSERFNRSLAAMDRFFNQYVLIPDGKYTVGKKRSIKGERARQMIELSSFYMGKFPVTNALFEVFVEKTGYKTTAEREGYGTVYVGRVQSEVDEETGLETYTWSSSVTNKIVKGACWYQPQGPGSTLHKKRNHPVVQVSLEDALAFAAWTGKGLPTEDEWEAASRTASGYSLPWGKKWERDACNFEDTSIGDTTPVDRFMEWENELGIADTLGNVWEWTSTPFENGAESNGRSYIAKGGSWVTGKPLNLATRFRVDPASYSNILGFRCVAY